MSREFTARLGFISLSTSSFYGPVNFSGSSLVGIGTGSVLFTNASGSVTGSSNLVWDNVNGRLGIGTSASESYVHINQAVSNINDTTHGLKISTNAYNSTGRHLYLQNIANTYYFSIGGLNGGALQMNSNVGIQWQYSGNTVATFGTYYDGTNFSGVGIIARTNGTIPLIINGATSQTANLMMIKTAPAGSYILTVSNVGNTILGTNTTDAGYRLDVNGSGSASGALRVVSGSALFDVTSGSLSVTSGASSFLFVSSSGNVGIGSTLINTNFKLGVQGTIATTGYINFQGSNGLNNNTGLGYIGLGTNSFELYTALDRSMRFLVGNEVMRLFSTTGNLMLQSGGTFTDSGYRLDVNGSGAASGSLRVSGSTLLVGAGSTSATNALVVQNSSATTILRARNDGEVIIGSWLTVGVSQRYLYRSTNTSGIFTICNDSTIGARIDLYGSTHSTDPNYIFISASRVTVNSPLTISGSSTQPAIVGNSLTSVNIIPTMVFTTASQTQTAFKVMPTFSGSSAFTSSQSNIIADFGATSVGSQLIVTDVTSGSIYMVNDVSGIPIVEATSDWNFLLYDYPYTVFKKTGSMIELGVPNQTSSFTLFKSDLIVNEGLGFYQRTSQVSGSTNGAVTSSLYNIQFTNTSASVYISAIVTGYDTGSRDTIAGDIKATIRYRGGVASIVGIDQTFINTDNSVVGFDIVAGGTSGSLVAFGTGSRVYQWGATITTQVI